MQVDSFPRCCGLKIIHGFGGHFPNEKSKRKALAQAFQAAEVLDAYGLVNIMVTLSSDQKPVWDKVLRDFEFYEVSLAMKNKYHKDRPFHIYIWNEAEERNNIPKILEIART